MLLVQRTTTATHPNPSSEGLGWVAVAVGFLGEIFLNGPTTQLELNKILLPMRRFLVLALGFSLVWGLVTGQPTRANNLNTARGNPVRPWTYWWWMGSAVNNADLTRQLEGFAKAGIGGVHVIPIYGVKGYENQFLPFLGEKWLAAFRHTVREAKRLGLGVDLTTGTGWPFGGPNVSPDEAAKKWAIQDGKLTAILTRQRVKRAAPGGEGLVVDYFNKRAVQRYLGRFDSTLARMADQPRAVYNDSYEVYGANWTTNFLQEFQKRRGYDLNDRLADFLDSTGTEAQVRVMQDYHETLSDLLRDGFTQTWTAWARGHGYQTRHQAHGSPGNLLDLYALADIPETESFGSSRFPIPGLRVDENYEVDRFGTPNALAMKFASSAAHLTGKKLVSSETGTWLADHFKVSLSQLKPQIDELFTAGINHIFFHGIAYSPAAEKWPGWLFYASTNYGSSSHVWKHLPLLTGYIERCQSRLQASQPDNDVLVYFPIHDLWAKPAKSGGGIHALEVHHVERWLMALPFGRLCERLKRGGYGFDYVSDRQLDSLRVGPNGTIQARGGGYRVIVVPETIYLPEATARRLLQLAKQGARIVFLEKMPKQVPGAFNPVARAAELQRITEELKRQETVTITAEPLEGALFRNGVWQERWAVNTGLSFIRKKTADGNLHYFITNLTNKIQTDSLHLKPFERRYQSVLRYDPVTDQTDSLMVRNEHVPLSLAPGESVFLTARTTPISAEAKPSLPPTDVLTLRGTWRLDFPEGAPYRPAPQTRSEPGSWVLPGDTTTGWFSGTGRYSLLFSVPAGFPTTRNAILDLGDVREVAEVRLNGQSLGTAWCLPFRLAVPPGVLRGENTLEISVTNLSANRARFLDQKGVSWKKFYDINLVDIRYRPFDATRWEPVPSGLLGPVRLLMTP